MSTIRPTAHLRLPDGQVITATVLARRRAQHAWWYHLQVDLYADQHPGAGTTATPAPHEFWVPQGLVQPIPGQHYTALDPRLTTGGTWLVVPKDGRLVVHDRNCWEVDAKIATAMSTTEVVQLLRARRAITDGCSEGALQPR